MTITASIVGGSGYVGGELLRLLLAHPQVKLGQITSESQTGRFVHTVHPNLRGRTQLKFSSASELAACDLLFLALPHGHAQKRIAEFAQLAPKLIDLSADFRLRNPQDYLTWYSEAHANPDWLARFAYGLPELNRSEIAESSYVSGVGCNATATNLAIWPLFKVNLADRTRDVIVEVKVGSSEGGNTPSESSHHPERAGTVRSFMPTRHRHTAEVLQTLRKTGDVPPLHFSITSVELVRGAVATAHVFLKDKSLTEKDLWQAYRAAYRGEPFVRIVKEARGIYRYPEPKILAGSNFADVGFELDPESGRVVAICAIDNLMKGAAGSAVQAMNIQQGWPETMSLEFTGLHP